MLDISVTRSRRWVCIGSCVVLVGITLYWRHNGRDSVSNHQLLNDCLLNPFFRRRSKKTSKLRVTGLCVGNSPGPVNSPHKWPVTRKMFPFDDVSINQWCLSSRNPVGIIRANHNHIITKNWRCQCNKTCILSDTLCMIWRLESTTLSCFVTVFLDSNFADLNIPSLLGFTLMIHVANVDKMKDERSADVSSYPLNLCHRPIT